MNEGLIQNCSFSGSVSGRLNTGGIAGTNAAGNRIRDCSVSGSMEGARQTGGIAGYSTGIIEDCTNTSVIGYPHVSYNTGGIAGRSCGYIRSCENTGVIYGRKDVGDIVGQAEPYVELQLSESSLSTIEAQLSELNALIDQAAAHASGGASSVSARLGTMSGYVDSAWRMLKISG